jgi:hypothetical protein
MFDAQMAGEGDFGGATREKQKLHTEMNEELPKQIRRIIQI